MGTWKCVCDQPNHYDVTSCVRCGRDRHDEQTETDRWEAVTDARARELWLRLWDNGRDTGLDGFTPGVDGPRDVVVDMLVGLVGLDRPTAEVCEQVNVTAESHNGSPRDERPADYFGRTVTVGPKCDSDSESVFYVLRFVPGNKLPQYHTDDGGWRPARWVDRCRGNSLAEDCRQFGKWEDARKVDGGGFRTVVVANDQ